MSKELRNQLEEIPEEEELEDEFEDEGEETEEDDEIPEDAFSSLSSILGFRQVV